MSEYPATLGDLADVEARLDARLTRLAKRQESDSTVTDEKVSELRGRVIDATGRAEMAEAGLVAANRRLAELERLWAVALENPEMIRELAAQALKGPQGG